MFTHTRMQSVVQSVKFLLNMRESIVLVAMLDYEADLESD